MKAKIARDLVERLEPCFNLSASCSEEVWRTVGEALLAAKQYLSDLQNGVIDDKSAKMRKGFLDWLGIGVQVENREQALELIDETIEALVVLRTAAIGITDLVGGSKESIVSAITAAIDDHRGLRSNIANAPNAPKSAGAHQLYR